MANMHIASLIFTGKIEESMKEKKKGNLFFFSWETSISLLCFYFRLGPNSGLSVGTTSRAEKYC